MRLFKKEEDASVAFIVRQAKKVCAVRIVIQAYVRFFRTVWRDRRRVSLRNERMSHRIIAQQKGAMRHTRSFRYMSAFFRTVWRDRRRDSLRNEMMLPYYCSAKKGLYGVHTGVRAYVRFSRTARRDRRRDSLKNEMMLHCIIAQQKKRSVRSTHWRSGICPLFPYSMA